MKSIKEKAEEHLNSVYYGYDNVLKTLVKEGYEAGANYVLEKFIDIVNKNTKPNGMEDRAKMANDMLILIKQLKK